MKRCHLLATVATMVLLAACGPTVPASIQALNTPPGIANLMKDRLRSDLEGRTTTVRAPFVFPARVRVVPYDFKSNLQQVDVLAAFDSVADALRKQPELALDASVLPEAYGDSVGASFDGLLKLHERSRADAFLLISGRDTFVEARERAPNFFEWLARKSNWEGHMQLEALYVDAASKQFLPSLQAAARVGPELVVADDNSTTSSAYAVRRTAAQRAFKNLAEAVVTQLKAELKAQGKASPKPTTTPATGLSPEPSASPSGSPTPAATGSPDATPTPSPSASASAAASASPAASATPTESATPTASPSPSPSATPSAGV